MSEEEKKERDEDEEEDEDDDEELTDEERRKRRLKRLLEKLAEKDFKKRRKVDKGFEGAFGGQEGAHKYYRHHNFTFTAEPKDKPPEIKPSQATGEYWKEKHLWYPDISHQTENPVKNDEKPHDEILPYDELERIEAEARLDFTLETAPLEEMPEPINEVNKIMPTDYTFMEEPIEPTDDDIVRDETLRKLGHGPGRCVPPDVDDEEVY